ncbi:MAG: transcription termination/antitermination protein NusA [Chitinophagaceae bacterium]|nr:MAG: transcription termination/antitermination protein NusA [Chitinophagaceae bacterium]
MNSEILVESFTEFKERKNIARPILMKILEDVFRTIIKKEFGSDDNFDIIVNTDRGDLEIFRKREIVADEDLEDENLQIPLSVAKEIDEDYEIGEEHFDEIGIADFSRRSTLVFKQTLRSRLNELEKDEVFKKYKDREGEVVIGEVYQTWKDEILILDDEGNEMILPRREKIPTDFFKKGDNVKALIKEVKLINANPKIILSRTHPDFLARLLEEEVPEIYDGLIMIKKIVRKPGEKAKVAVESMDERIDPVGACVGMKGSRIHGIVRELKNENIDIINYTSNLPLFITRALAPSKIQEIKIDEENKKAVAYVNPDQVSLAIGRGGLNIKLAGDLVGYEIDVYRNDIEIGSELDDVDINEFRDEIDNWIIDELIKIGCDTAKSVLKLEKEELVRRTDLEVETIEDLIKILSAEFEE